MNMRSVQIVILNSIPLIINLFANNVICRTIRPKHAISIIQSWIDYKYES